MLRAQEHLSDLHGVEDFSAPREWNDEIQSIRTLKANDLSSKILKARLEYRMVTEFTEACRRIVMAISEGLIAPLIYSDPSQSDIYVYNGIFFSRAEDTKDAYSIHVGEEAARKSAARDFFNQKLIRSLDIPGMNNILCTIVDYKGSRYIGQSIIPGILNSGENCAQLMYGVLEKGKIATVKESSLPIFEELAKKLQLTTRRIPAVPFQADENETSAGMEGEAGQHVDALTELLKTADTNQASPIRVDETGNVAIDSTTNSLPHCGPIEGKLLRGADGRTYALEVMRLTPRDANYVAAERGGSERISDELLSKTDTSIAPTYVLRQELIGIYIQRRVNMARQALLTELSGKERSFLKKEDDKKTDASAVSVEDVKDEEDEEGVQIVKEEKSNEEEGHISEEDQEKLALEYREKYSAITPESLGIEINPNVFLNFEADIDPEVVAKDEKTAREMAVFLYDSVLPMLTRQVREGDMAPRDPETMVNLLHRMGVNMRYLGRLSQLALEQEREDAELMFQNKQRVHSMPYFWLEFLTVELLARSAKHMLNQALRADSAVASSPAGTIAAMLNNFLSLLKESTEAVPETKEGDVAAITNSTPEPEKKVSKKAEKKAKKGAKVVSSSAIADAIGKLEITQVVAPVVATKDAFVAALADVLEKKYLCETPLLAKPEVVDANSDDKLAWKQMQTAMMKQRVSPVMLVRRICQQCGIVLACRSVDLKKHAANVSGPFHVNDILGLVPKVKSCEPDAYLPEVPDMLSSSNGYLNQGNAVVAFELAQQSMNFISQITGPNHLQALQASEQLTNVLVHSADFKSASQMTTRTLGLTAQVQGLDNSNMVHHHLQLAVLETELNNYQGAFHHLTTAKYILEVIGGEHHPDMISIFTRLSILYEKVNDFESALHSLLRARMFVHDLVNNAGITMAMANLLYRHNRFHEAVHAQKSAYKILKELVSIDDERVIEAKKNLEVYIRAAATAPRPEYIGGPNAEQANVESVAAIQGNAGNAEDGEKDAKKKRSNNKKKGKK
jgi:protein TIF31